MLLLIAVGIAVPASVQGLCGEVINTSGLAYYTVPGMLTSEAVDKFSNGDNVHLGRSVKTATQEGPYGGKYCYVQVIVGGHSYWSKLHTGDCGPILGICDTITCEIDPQTISLPGQEWFLKVRDC